MSDHHLDPNAPTPSPQSNWEPPTPDELNQQFPLYIIEALIGRGGMGAIYRARHEALDRVVAIKLLLSELATDSDFVERFQREARIMAKLHHPGIVMVHDFGQCQQGNLYLIMEYVDGSDLHRQIAGGGLTSSQTLEFIIQICDALQYAHSQGVNHRDIKPANILIDKDGRAKLADFGLARPMDDECQFFTRTNVVMGTPDYMAPEAVTGKSDHRSDIYSLGILLYEALTGRPPKGAWPPPSQRVAVDPRVDGIVVRALQEDPALRYQNAGDLKADLSSIQKTKLTNPISNGNSGAPKVAVRRAPEPEAKVRRAIKGNTLVIPEKVRPSKFGSTSEGEIKKAPTAGNSQNVWIILGLAVGLIAITAGLFAMKAGKGRNADPTGRNSITNTDESSNDVTESSVADSETPDMGRITEIASKLQEIRLLAPHSPELTDLIQANQAIHLLVAYSQNLDSLVTSERSDLTQLLSSAAFDELIDQTLASARLPRPERPRRLGALVHRS